MSKSATMLISTSFDAACPSDLLFDRWHLGELESAKAKTIDAHIGVCPACASRRDLRQSGFDAYAVDADRLFERLSTAKPRGMRTWFDDLRAALGWRAPLLAATALATAFVLNPELDAERSEIRTKGGASFRVFRERGGVVEEAMTKDRFVAHDRIRFDVAVESGSQIMVVGVEDSGEVFTYYPTNDEGSAAVKRRSDGALVGAIELDDYHGREWLHLVRCDRAFVRGDLDVHPGRQGVRAPPNCDVSTFEMQRGDE